MMSKCYEELITLKEEVETLNKKLAELTKEELEQVTGGNIPTSCPKCGGILRSRYGMSGLFLYCESCHYTSHV